MVTIMLNAEKIIEMFQMKPLEPEGGFFVETYRAERSLSTAILYLLTAETRSLLHRLPTDEIWHFYLGDPVRMLHLYPGGDGFEYRLGHDLMKGERIQLTVPAGVWQGASLIAGGNYALLGTTMAPGFDPDMYEAGDRRTLMQEYPHFTQIIAELTD
jgi:predicted cupin superfamily sugar epimerase